MSWIKGFNFRATTGFVTDGANETYVLGSDVGGSDYPVTRNGVTFGWASGAVSQSRDRNAGLDRRLAGVQFTLDPDASTFRVDLPAAGDYIIGLASGDAYGAVSAGRIEILDTSTSRLVIDHPSGFTAGVTFRDATDVDLSAANWPGTNARVTLAFATTILNVTIGASGRAGRVAHLYIEQVETGGAQGGAYHQTIARTRGWGRWV